MEQIYMSDELEVVEPQDLLTSLAGYPTIAYKQTSGGTSSRHPTFQFVSCSKDDRDLCKFLTEVFDMSTDELEGAVTVFRTARKSFELTVTFRLNLYGAALDLANTLKTTYPNAVVDTRINERTI